MHIPNTLLFNKTKIVRESKKGKAYMNPRGERLPRYDESLLFRFGSGLLLKFSLSVVAPWQFPRTDLQVF